MFFYWIKQIWIIIIGDVYRIIIATLQTKQRDSCESKYLIQNYQGSPAQLLQTEKQSDGGWGGEGGTLVFMRKEEMKLIPKTWTNSGLG